MRNVLAVGLAAALAAAAPVSTAVAGDSSGLQGYQAAKFKKDKGDGGGSSTGGSGGGSAGGSTGGDGGKDKKDKGGDPVQPQDTSTPCAMSDIGLSSGSCFGWAEGNFNSGNGSDKSFSATVLNTLMGVNTFSGPTLSWTETLGSISGNSVNFNTTLYGLTVVAFHVGGAGGQSTGVGYQATAWYAFDAGTTGVDVLAFNRAGLSNARLFRTGPPPPCLTCNAVPEPDAWGLMILGFFGAGAALRSRRWKLA